MKNLKKIKMFFIIIGTILLASTPLITYALNIPGNTNNDNEDFFSVDKTEVNPGETITMSINLSKIKYNDFKFSLSSNEGIDDIKVEDESVSTNIENNKFSIITSKSNNSVEKINLLYTVPSDVKIGSKIKLNAQVENYSNSDVDNEVDTDDNTEDNQIQNSEIIITIIEKNENDNEQNNNEENNKNEKDFDDGRSSENKNDVQNKTNLENTGNQGLKITTSKSSISTQINTNMQETVSYNGESNNYLSSLIINGNEFSPEFTKTNNTYFVNVDNNTTSLEIEATAEDENAKINIYGNENIQSGENKILVSVTAENGDVRIYRIYVTQK